MYAHTLILYMSICTCIFITAVLVPPTMTKVFLIPVGPSGEVQCDGKCGGFYQWEVHDFTIILPPDCADGRVTFTIEAYLPSSSQDHCIVSAVFKINTKINSFKKPITIRFPHWVNVESEKERQRLHLLICHQNSCDIEKGYFEVGKQFGSVKISKFSPIFVCIAHSLTIIKAYIYSLIAGSTQPQNITMMLEEGPTTETTTKADNNDYLDLLILPLNKDWRKYCIIKNNATYCQVCNGKCSHEIQLYVYLRIL